MGHIIVDKAEELLDKFIPVLDKGFVRLVDYYGDDSRIVQAARVSYGKGTKTVREDKSLIDYLMRNEHTSPFEQVVFTFHCKMPIFVARQWIRHRTARVNEISGRYSIMKEEFYVPDISVISPQSKNNKQGRSKEPFPEPEAKQIQEKIVDFYNTVAHLYNDLLEKGLARELARIVLPLSLYTEWYWQMDLKNLLHFLKLRLDEHAQYEIREYAKAIASIVKVVVPFTWEAFEKNVLKSVKISFDEIKIVKNLLDENIENITQKANKNADNSRTVRILKDKIERIL